MPLPTVGAKAPWPADITTQSGRPVKLSDHAGKHVILYFYPKDDTPGCTVQACNFRDHLPDLPPGTVVYGASLDNAASHQAFIAKFKLPFDLLIDPRKELAHAYGAITDGTARNAARVTVLIGPDGLVKATWPKVDVKTHWEDVRKAMG